MGSKGEPLSRKLQADSLAELRGNEAGDFVAEHNHAQAYDEPGLWMSFSVIWSTQYSN